MLISGVVTDSLFGASSDNNNRSSDTVISAFLNSATFNGSFYLPSILNYLKDLTEKSASSFEAAIASKDKTKIKEWLVSEDSKAFGNTLGRLNSGMTDDQKNMWPDLHLLGSHYMAIFSARSSLLQNFDYLKVDDLDSNQWVAQLRDVYAKLTEILENKINPTTPHTYDQHTLSIEITKDEIESCTPPQDASSLIRILKTTYEELAPSKRDPFKLPTQGLIDGAGNTIENIDNCDVFTFLEQGWDPFRRSVAALACQGIQWALKEDIQNSPFRFGFNHLLLLADIPAKLDNSASGIKTILDDTKSILPGATVINNRVSLNPFELMVAVLHSQTVHLQRSEGFRTRKVMLAATNLPYATEWYGASLALEVVDNLGKMLAKTIYGENVAELGLDQVTMNFEDANKVDNFFDKSNRIRDAHGGMVKLKAELGEDAGNWVNLAYRYLVSASLLARQLLHESDCPIVDDPLFLTQTRIFQENAILNGFGSVYWERFFIVNSIFPSYD